MQLQVITDDAGIIALEPDWRRIHAEARDVSIFSGWDWLSLWWHHYGGERRLRVLVASADGVIVGILPLYIERSRLVRFVSIQNLRMVGSGGDTSPDYLGPIVLEQFREQACQAFAGWIANSSEWDMLHLNDLVSGTGIRKCIATACATYRRPVRIGTAAKIAVVTLPSTWDEYLASLDKGDRYSVTRYLKKAEKSGASRFYWWEDQATLDQAIDRLIVLHRMRWHGRSASHSFASERYIAFHRTLMKRLAERGELALQCLEHEGEIIAMQYEYLFRGRLYDFQGGFDPSYANLRPGRVLTTWALRDAIERGIREYDFLKGEYRHKLLWTRQFRKTGYVRSFSTGWRGRLAHLRHGVLPSWKGTVRRALKSDLA